MSYSILNAIGDTPLVEIKKLNPNSNVKILAKLEYTNPGGSIKDRAAFFMIEAGEKSGELTPDKTVIEATSGNTGIGLALVCAVKGYRLLLAMSDGASIERRKILKARGAEILLTPGHLGTDGAIEEVYRLVRENPETYFMADQYNNPANWKAHYYGTAPEIWRQSGKTLTTLVATMGTSGTLMGMARRLKEYDNNIRIVGVEPFLGHKIQGLKNMKEAYCPEIFEKNRLDKKVNIEDEEAFEMTRRLAREEGLFVGMSSGAAMAIACREAAAMTSGTIGAAFEAAGYGIPSIAISTQVVEERHKFGDGRGYESEFEACTSLLRKVASRAIEEGLPDGVDVLNINVPHGAHEHSGVLLTRLARKLFKTDVEKRNDPRGRPYYWISGGLITNGEEGTDSWALYVKKCISVTPLSLDMSVGIDGDKLVSLLK